MLRMCTLTSVSNNNIWWVIAAYYNAVRVNYSHDKSMHTDPEALQDARGLRSFSLLHVRVNPCFSCKVGMVTSKVNIDAPA